MRKIMDHLSQEEIQEYRAGSLDSEARRHLHECERCRHELLEDRLLDILLVQALDLVGDTVPPQQAHPSLEAFLRYIEADLDIGAATRFETHLADCGACTVRLLSLRTPPEDALLQEPPRALQERVRSRFVGATAPRPVGQIFLEALNRGTVRLTFRPTPGSTNSGYSVSQSLMAAQSPHASQTGRQQSPSPLELTIGAVRLTLAGVQTGGRIAITIVARNANSGGPQPDLTVSLVPSSGDRVDSHTDSQGQAVLSISSERARLLFGTVPASEIELRLVQ